MMVADAGTAQRGHTMDLGRLLIANRGEIAIRVARAAADLGITTVAVHPADDAASLHVRITDEAHQLTGRGAAAYLDIDQIVAVAVDHRCDALHPGYGFLAENAALARACADAGLVFVGPRPELLDLFGDKTRARALAVEQGVPALPGTSSAVATLAEAESLLDSLATRRDNRGGAVIVKAVAGGGGRGMRVVTDRGDLAEAFERCQSEALSAFGNGAVYVETYLPVARHVEVQILGDRAGAVAHVGTRECSIQRRHQKLIEVAPAPDLSPVLRDRLHAAAVTLAEAVRYDNVGTFEFLLDASGEAHGSDPDAPFYFLEANPRIQVEHTVTEQVTGIDLVQTQLRLAAGATLAELGLDQASVPPARGFAVQVRVNTESTAADGTTTPTGGTITAFDMPTGPGVRVDTYGYSGYRTNPSYDSLLAKVIAWSPSPSATFGDAVGRAYRALSELRVEGVVTNTELLLALLRHPDVVAGRMTTTFLDTHAAALVAGSSDHTGRAVLAGATSATAGARLASNDPLAVLAHGKQAPAEARTSPTSTSTSTSPSTSTSTMLGAPDGIDVVLAPMQGTIVMVSVVPGDHVRAGGQLLVMEAMKMEHVIAAPTSGVVRGVNVEAGDTVYADHELVYLQPGDVDLDDAAVTAEVDLDAIRPDLADVVARHAVGFDEQRPDAVARRTKTGQRTARQNVDDLLDPGSYIEYGALAIAAQRRRRTVEDLIARTPADGMIAGIGRVNGDRFDDSKSRCVVMSYDYTVLAGTQGLQNHRKKDRLFELAETWRLPVVFFTEGGGGRPGDTDGLGMAGLDCWAFTYFARLSGLVPLVGINSGRCFAGNAALLGSCDVVIATANSNIGMGGPAMIEGGGLGVFRPDEVGPMDVQTANGVVDIAVADEAEAVAVAKRYLSYFQGPVTEWSCADQRRLRHVIPENRLRVYDVRRIIDLLADDDSVLELRRDFGVGMITALIRVEGRPLGVVANNPMHLAGAIDSPGADKAARFMQLCDAFDLPVLNLCDTPGMMVGPEVEKTALVRHCCRLFVTGANLTVPTFTIVLRKGYGLGAQAMAAGSFKATFFTVAWPTGEFGGMGLEGAVKLGYRNELAAVDDPPARKKLFDDMVARMYEHGKALSTATHFEIDDVIDPADSRRWIASVLRSVPPVAPRQGKKRPNIDTW